jgi:hypothetical protein
LNNNLPYLIETHTPVSRTSAGRASAGRRTFVRIKR